MARKAGIRAVYPQFAKLSDDRQATLARGALPWRALWPRLAEKQKQLELIGLDRALTSIPEAGFSIDDRTVDGRYWYGARGMAGLDSGRAYVGVEKVDDVRKGTGRDTAAHELTHLVHTVLSPAKKRRLDAMFEDAKARGRILDPYSWQDVYEYFARGYEIWLSHQGDIAHEGVRPDVPPLLVKDRALYDCITAATRGR